MNLPNKLTVLRVLMVPFFVLFMLTDLGGAANKWIALAIFVVASLTDLLDIEKGSLAAWIVIVIIAREFIISGFRLVASDNGIVIAASYWGKFKTVFQMAMVIVLIMDLGGAFDVIGQALIWISLALTIISLIDYVAKNIQVLTNGGM